MTPTDRLSDFGTGLAANTDSGERFPWGHRSQYSNRNGSGDASFFRSLATQHCRDRDPSPRRQIELYIMSGDIPPRIPLPFFSGISVMTAWVVRTMAAIEAAFWRAERVTLAGSTMPAANMSTNLLFRAS
jgi:hypothetical protein